MASLYRRHRPRAFADVVGQEHVVRTLRNAIEQDKVHHAYLFVGSRGTGKTSMAKILAASLNCVKGPTTEPDGTCESCRSIASATSLDVIEMDAASNNSVDDIRDLRERVAYAPVAGHYKVYILDEAHMLTPAAWNAFLKTLEEPPPHTLFVLATTEVAKVLPTVADRCHRFDFGRPTIAQIAQVIRRAAEAEGIQAPDDAVALIARSATGSFRDALGTLEQLVAYSGSTIALEDVLAVLGAADDDLLYGTLDAIAAGSARDVLLGVARLADSGRDVARFFGDLETHARALMVVQTLGTVPAELAMTPETDARLLDQAGRVGPSAVTHVLDLLADGLRAMKDGADARTQLELALIKAADPIRDAGQQALLARIERLERGAPPAPAPVRAPEQPATPAAQAMQTVSTDDVVAAPVEVRSTPAHPVVAVDDLGGFRELWPAVLEQLSSTPMGAFLAEAVPVAYDADSVTIAFAESNDILHRQADRPANRDAIKAAIRTVTSRALALKLEKRADEELELQEELVLGEDELIDRVMQEFDATEETQ